MCVGWLSAYSLVYPPSPNIYIGWVGVSWQRHSKTCCPLRGLDNQGTVLFYFGGRPQLVVELDPLYEVKNLYSAQGNCSYDVVFKVRHPRGSYIQ